MSADEGLSGRLAVVTLRNGSHDNQIQAGRFLSESFFFCENNHSGESVLKAKVSQQLQCCKGDASHSPDGVRTFDVLGAGVNSACPSEKPVGAVWVILIREIAASVPPISRSWAGPAGSVAPPDHKHSK